MMDCQTNSFENLIQSFKSVCYTLEANANSDLMDVKKQCKEEFSESAKTLEAFNGLTSGVSETCKEVLNCSEVLHALAKRTNSEASINVPYEIHADLVNSIRSLYNMTVPGLGASGEKLISERNKQLMNDLIKECEKNIFDTKDIQSVLINAKAALKWS